MYNQALTFCKLEKKNEFESVSTISTGRNNMQNIRVFREETIWKKILYHISPLDLVRFTRLLEDTVRDNEANMQKDSQNDDDNNSRGTTPWCKFRIGRG